MSSAPLGSIDNPIRPDQTKLKIGIDVSGAVSRLEAFTHVLLHEPHIEYYRELFPERELTCVIMESDRYRIDYKKFLSGPNFQNIKTLTSQEVFDLYRTPDWVDLTEQINRNLVCTPKRTLPCPGFQNWALPTPRARTLMVALNDDTEFKIKTDKTDQVLHHCLTEPYGEEEFEAFIRDIRQADMVCTDNAMVAFIALCFSVPKITCLGLYGTDIPYDIEKSEVKFFRRVSGSQSENYQRMQDFAQREWSQHYSRYPSYLNTGNAQSFIRNEALKYCRGFGLDVGANEWPLLGALPSDVDSRKFDQGPFDFIFSSHCLEHIEDWESELKLWHDSLKPDGIMFIYVPHPLMEMWLPEGPWVRGGWHKWSPDPVGLNQYLSVNLKMDVLTYTTRPDAYWSFHIVARKK